MATENIKSRKAYRVLVDPINKIWDRMHFITDAKSVDADDGQTLETKVGAINGITSDVAGEADDIAASIKCVNELSKEIQRIKVLDYPKIQYLSSSSIFGNFTFTAPADGILRLFYRTDSTTGLNIEPTINSISIGKLYAQSGANVYDIIINKDDVFSVKFGTSWSTGICGLNSSAFIPYT